MLDRFFANHSFKVILVVLFLLPVLGRGARKALQSNDNDVHDWLPNTYAETKDFDWFKEHFENETFVLISWDGCTLEDEQRLELLVKKLVPEGDEPLEPQAVQKKAPAPPHWYDDLVIASWLKRPEDLHEDWGPLFKKVQTGPRLITTLTEAPIKLSEAEALDRMRGLFVGPDNKQTCAVITLTDAGKRDLKHTLKVLKSVTKNELGLDPARVRMGGPPVDNVAISEEGEKTLLRLFIPAGIVGLSLAFWCLRSVRLTIMVFATALYAGAISLAFVHYTGSAMNAILLTMPAVVYVAGVSGAIHFSNYYRDAVAEHGVEEAPARALKSSWLPCTLSAVTTSAGLISLYTSELVPIEQFGIYSAIGVISTLGLLFLFLPSWMQVWPMRPHSFLDGDQVKQENIDLPVESCAFLAGVLDHYKLVFASLLVVMIFCGYGLTKINTSIKLTKLFSSGAQIIHDYTWLEAKLGPLVPMEIVVKVDPEKTGMTMLERMQMVREIQDSLQDIPDIGNTMSATTFAPSLRIRGVGRSAWTYAATLNSRLETHKQEYIDNDFLDIENGVELWRISARVGALNDVDYGEFKNDISDNVEPVLAAWRKKLAERENEAAQEAALEAANAAGERQASAIEAPAAAELASSDMGLTAVYTGLVPVVYKAQREMLNGLAWNFVTDLLTIATVMSLVFMDISAGLIILIPSVFPILVVFGIMGWLGIVIDVGTIMTPTVALGVSVDDVVHFLIWYRRGLSEGRDRKGSIMLAYEDCARAMYQSWAVLGLGLAVFAFSSFVPTQRFGALMFTLLTASLIGNILLLPAVLSSPLAFFFGRRLRKKAAAEKSEHGEMPHAKINGEAANGDLANGELIIPTHRRDTSHRARTSK